MEPLQTFTPDQLVARANFADPYPVYRGLRDQSPVHYISIEHAVKLRKGAPMQCPQCQYENLPDAAFCQECGTRFQNVCSQCQIDNLPTAQFCRKCGTFLTGKAKGLGH